MIEALKKKSEFGFNLLTLVSGTVIAQLIPIAISPLLTRIYNPSEFGLFTLYISTSAVFMIMATMRYEIAIVQPRKDSDAISLVALSCGLSILMSLVSLCVIFFFNSQISYFLGNKAIGSWLYLIPVSVFLHGCCQSLNQLNTRKKHFKQIAKAKLGRSLGICSGQLGLKIFLLNGGLICGQLVGDFISLLLLAKHTFRRYISSFRGLNFSKILANAKAYSRIPKYSLLGAFANCFTLHLPIFMLGNFYDPTIVGNFGLAWKVLSVPSSLIHIALGRVLLQKIATMRYENPEKMFSTVFILFCILIAIVLPFVGILWLFGVDLFVFVFGPSWSQAGVIASLLVLSTGIQFIVSPFSVVLSFRENIKIVTAWQILYLMSLSISLYLVRYSDIFIFLKVFVVNSLVLYSLYFILILWGVKRIRVYS